MGDGRATAGGGKDGNDPVKEGLVEVVQLAQGVYHLRGGANMGLVVRDGRGLLIDCGLDKDAARRAQRVCEGLGVRLEGLLLTHAHADHFGGAHFLQRRHQVETVAPQLEAAMMENPIFEPLFLFGGAAPITDLREKFTLAEPCRVDRQIGPGALTIGPFAVEAVPLPGHAPNQMGVAVGEILFCADAIFPAETLQKHKVIFCADMDDALETLKRLPELPYARFAPGHGPAYNAGEEIAAICEANQRRLEAVREQVYAALEAPRGTSEVVQSVARRFELHLTTPTAYYLTRATILAALSSLERKGEVEALVRDNRLLWKRA